MGRGIREFKEGQKEAPNEKATSKEELEENKQ